ncbi:deoxyribose-phosphate aldolase [Cetobacterium somerae]|uniref:deoxyribose-phosphate aldolase n=1 Tax=Cetobacterium somerae TaxID=188913 RepID=UPI003D769757
MKLNKFINHTLLGADSKPEHIKTLCSEAKELKFYSVYVNGIYANLAAKELEGSSVKVGTIVGYPFGTSSTEVKIFEAKKYVNDGAHEISLIINLGMLKSGQIGYIRNEIENIKNVTKHKLLKVVIDLNHLTCEERNILVYMCLDLGINSFEILKKNIIVEDIIEIKNLTQMNLNINLVGNFENLFITESFINAGIKSFATSHGVNLSKKIKNKFWS